MKNALFALLIFTFAGNWSVAQDFTIEVDTTREYRVHLPQNYSPSNSYPLLFAIHGALGYNWLFENETSFSDLADTADIIVVYPQAIGTTRSWNTGICCGWSFNNGIDDFLFFEMMLDTLKASYNIDSTRIYSTGFSSGAMMTYALACRQSETFAAIAPVSSSMIIDQCSPTCTPVPVIHLHAEPDSSALFHGGVSPNPYLTFYYPPVDSVMNAWALKNSCDPTVDTTVLANGTRIYRWNNCAENTYQEIWLADDGGHKWPGTSGTGILNGDTATQDFYATEVVWSFLRQFDLICSDNSIQENQSDHSIGVYPNPVSDILSIEPHSNEVFAVEIYDGLGNILQQTTEQLKFDLSAYSAGIYFVKIQTDTGTEIVKVVKE